MVIDFNVHVNITNKSGKEHKYQNYVLFSFYKY